MMRRIYRYFSNPVKLSILNGILILILIILNIFFQAFCIPTPWAILMLLICFSNMILSPIIEQTRLAPVHSFISGFTFFVFSYCILFLEYMNIIGFYLIIVGIGIVTFIPHFFLLQIVWKNLIKPVSKTSRYSFLLAIFICLGIVKYIGVEYQNAIEDIKKFEECDFQELNKNFMTEKILGMHFKYHTRIEMIYDGWRPPMHEPIMVIGMWLNNRLDPLDIDLKKRLELYKKQFPENRYKYDCSCAMEYSQNYHADNLWK